MYGKDDKDFDEDYEGTDFNKRIASLAESNKLKKYGRQDPNMMLSTEEDKIDDITRAMMFNKGVGGAVGSTIPQLREQEFGYKQANRRVSHDGIAFMRGGNRTTAMIENEFLP